MGRPVGQPSAPAGVPAVPQTVEITGSADLLGSPVVELQALPSLEPPAPTTLASPAAPLQIPTGVSAIEPAAAAVPADLRPALQEPVFQPIEPLSTEAPVISQTESGAAPPRLRFTRRFAQAVAELKAGGRLTADAGEALSRDLAALFDGGPGAGFSRVGRDPDSGVWRLNRKSLSLFVHFDPGTNTATLLEARLRREVSRAGQGAFLKKVIESARTADEDLVREDAVASLSALFRVDARPETEPAASRPAEPSPLPVRRSGVQPQALPESAPWPEPRVLFSDEFQASISAAGWKKKYWALLRSRLQQMLAQGPSGAPGDTIWEFRWRHLSVYFHFDEAGRVVTLLEARPSSRSRRQDLLKLVDKWRKRGLAAGEDQAGLSGLLGAIEAPPRPSAAVTEASESRPRHRTRSKRVRLDRDAVEQGMDPRVRFTVDFVEGARALARRHEDERWTRRDWNHLRSELLRLLDGDVSSSILAKRGLAREAGVRKFKWGQFRIFFLFDPASRAVTLLDVRAKQDILRQGENNLYEELGRRARADEGGLAGVPMQRAVWQLLGPIRRPES